MANEEIEQYLPDNVEKDKYKFINAGTEFNMIMTAIGAYSYEGSRGDYAKSWNREITNSRGFSCSYIGNDMIATAPVRDVCYGFSKMENDSLLLAGDRNLGSATNQNELLVDENYVDYQRPENLKESTVEYNEMVFKREQNGKRKQPDYLLVFKNDGKIANMEKTLKAVDDFKKEGIDLPIVVVDIQRCIESEKSKIENMLTEVQETNNKELWEAAKKKLDTNLKTTNVKNTGIFRDCFNKLSNLYSQVFTKDSKNNEVKEETYQESYEQTTAEERKEETSKIVQLKRKVMSIIKGKEVEENER